MSEAAQSLHDMNLLQFGIVLPPEELDLEFCVRSGQTFRWRRVNPPPPDPQEEGGRGAEVLWGGVDAGTWWVVRTEGGPLLKTSDVADRSLSMNYVIRSNATKNAFTSYFRLEQSLLEVQKQIRAKAPELSSCLSNLNGLRVLNQSNPEEVFFSFLCTPNNNVERITRMVRTLASYGEPLQAPFEASQFPTAERIATIPEQELRDKAFGYRGKTIPNAARELLERGPGWLVGLKQTSYREAHAELCRVTGIGPKLADCICLFGLEFTEAVPVDTHLWQSACRTYFPEWKGRSLTDLRYREIGDLFRSKFGKLAGWAHQYMFYENFLKWRKRA